MSLVFPNSLAARTANLALSRGALWFGVVCLGAVFLSILAVMVERSLSGAWPALLALVAIACAGGLLSRPAGDRGIVIAAAAALALLGNLLFLLVVLPRLEVTEASDMIVLSLVKMAIIFFGAIVGRSRSGVVGIVVAALIAEVPVVLLAQHLNRPVTFDVPAVTCAAGLLAILALLSTSRKRARASEPVLSRASLDDRRATEAARAEHSSAAMVHDTILNELAVIGAVAPGPLTPAAREQIARSVSLVAAAQTDATAQVDEHALRGDVADAVVWATSQGLDVAVDGDVAAVESLPDEVSAALALAVLQCLTNVIAHAGVASAEVTVIATDSQVCVMVIDSGVGFAESETGADRMGLKHSVRGRIASVGGSVQVWSGPGAGTAISMLVPR